MHQAKGLLTPTQVVARIKQMSKGKHLIPTQVAEVAMVSPQFILPSIMTARTELPMVIRFGKVVELRIG